MSETYCHEFGKSIKTPARMVNFFNDIEEVCKKHNLSIAHEDGHGSFLIETYSEFNMKMLRLANKEY